MMSALVMVRRCSGIELPSRPRQGFLRYWNNAIFVNGLARRDGETLAEEREHAVVLPLDLLVGDGVVGGAVGDGPEHPLLAGRHAPGFAVVLQRPHRLDEGGGAGDRLGDLRGGHALVDEEGDVAARAGEAREAGEGGDLLRGEDPELELA